MANFNHDTLSYLKNLCRLDCSAEEDQDILECLPRILDYIKLLDEVNTENTKTCRYVLRGMLKNQMREDEVKDPLPREEFLSNAPDQIGGMIRVPPIMKPGS